MVPKVQLHWICISTLFFVENLASSFVMPTYEDCNNNIYLDTYTPAAKITIRHRYEYFYGHHISTLNTTQNCLNQVRVMDGFFIGVLMLDRYKAVECSPSVKTCKCQYPRFYLEIKTEYMYTGKWYCYTGEKGTLETDVETHSLDIAWNLTATSNSTEYSLLVFRMRKHCFSYEERTRCHHTVRCLDDNLLCTPPYKFCGDGSILCDNNKKVDTSSRSSAISGIIVTSLVLIILGITFYVCFGNDRVCRVTRWFRRRGSNNNSNQDIRAREVFTIQLATRGVPPNRPATGIDNTAFTEDPPDYDSLNITDLGSSTNAEIKDELPPGYDHVMSNTNDYNVNSSPSV